MKTINLFRACAFFSVVMLAQNALAQHHGPKDADERAEKIEQLKIAFFTKELDMSTDEAEKFWPIYNELDDKIRKEKKEQKKVAEELRKGISDLSDNDIKSKTNAIFDSEIKLAETRKEYNQKIADVIGYKKAAKLLSLEHRFKRELLNKLTERPPHPPQQHGPPPGGQRRGPNGPGPMMMR